MVLKLDDEKIETLAKALISCGGGDPEQMVQIGRPMIFGTPQGEAFGVTPSAAEPLWVSYKGAAKLALEMASDQLLASPAPLKSLTNGELHA